MLQLHGGGVLLVWRPVQCSDRVMYCVQYCTDGGFEERPFLNYGLEKTRRVNDKSDFLYFILILTFKL